MRRTTARAQDSGQDPQDPQDPHARSERLFDRYRQQRVFGMQTAVVRFDDAVYFVPRYGIRRPVAAKILRKRYAAPGVHDLVATVMERRPGSMVHAGTFFGDMLPSFSRKTPGFVYAFEPVIENYLLARRVAHRNELENVILYNAGLAQRPGRATMETGTPRAAHKGGGSQIVTDDEQPVFRPQVVPLLSIDQFAIDDLSLIQLDVEGYEPYVLEGALETIARLEPVIVVEDNSNACGDLLRDLGYSERERLGRDHVYLTEAGAEQFPEL